LDRALSLKRGMRRWEGGGALGPLERRRGGEEAGRRGGAEALLGPLDEEAGRRGGEEARRRGGALGLS
jgi:hypothetical protein